MWNQRRPFLLYWGTVQAPKYLQVRFLQNDYDFSSATFYAQQNENKVLSGINFISNGGDKHISIDRLQNGNFRAKDLRLRFEFGNAANADLFALPTSTNEPFNFTIDQLQFSFQLYSAEFNGLKGYWEKGGSGKTSWIDFVFYSGAESEFDLTKISRAVESITFSIDPIGTQSVTKKAVLSEKDGVLNIEWNGLKLEMPVKPQAPLKYFYLSSIYTPIKSS